MLLHNESNFLSQLDRNRSDFGVVSKRASYAQDFYAGKTLRSVVGFSCPASQPVLLNELPAHKLIFNVRVVYRCRDETGDAESGFHDEHREQ